METWNTGPHLIEFEPPDILHCHLRGPVEAHDLQEIVRIIGEELGKKRGILVYVVAYMETPDSTFTPAMRKAVLNHTASDWKAAVLVGGSALLRTATNVLARSVDLIYGRVRPFRTVETAEEARQYIAELRAKEKAGEKGTG